MSLAHKRILITRTRAQASELAQALESLGAEPILIPTIEIVPPTTYTALDHALNHLDTFNWLLFTSANAVKAYATRRQRFASEEAQNRVPHVPRPRGHRSEPPQTPKIAAIGPATAQALESIGLTPTLIPPKAIAESLAKALTPHAKGAHMLLIRAEQARDILPETLRAAGATLAIAEAYRTTTPKDSIQSLHHLLTTHPPDAITFTSSSTATNFFHLLTEASLTLPATTPLVSIGPITTQTLQGLGHPPTAEAQTPTIPSLIAALQSLF